MTSKYDITDHVLEGVAVSRGRRKRSYAAVLVFVVLASALTGFLAGIYHEQGRRLVCPETRCEREIPAGMYYELKQIK